MQESACPAVLAMKIDRNAPHAVGAGLKPAHPLNKGAVAIFIPLCGLHKVTVILRSAATKNLRPLHTRRAVEEITPPIAGLRFLTSLALGSE